MYEDKQFNCSERDDREMGKIKITLSDTPVSVIRRAFKDEGPFEWAYFGNSFSKMRRIEKELSAWSTRSNIAYMHEKIAERIRLGHVKWIEELNLLNDDGIEWWLSTISSRNVYNSNLFQYACYAEMFLEFIKERSSAPKLIIIESPALAELMLKLGGVRLCNEALLRRACRIAADGLKKCKETAVACLDLSSRLLAAFISRIKYGKKKIESGGRTVLINTFIHDESVKKDGSFDDRYYPYIYEYYKKNGVSIFVNPVLHGFRCSYLSIYSRMRASRTSFLIAEDFLKISDYLAALAYPLKYFFRTIIVKPFHGIDMSPVIKEEKRRESPRRLIVAFLMYRMFLRLGQTGLKPGTVMVWNENQVIDKAIVAGSRKAFPGAKILGSRLFVYSPNILNFFHTPSEVEAKVAPDLLLEMSERQGRLSKIFNADIPYQLVPALRYAYLFDGARDPGKRVRENKILVLASFSIEESLELLERIKDVLEDIAGDARILIKTHPDYAKESLLEKFGKDRWPPRFEFFEGKTRDAFDQAALAISSNSSAMVEAAINGIPVISLGSETALSQNRLYGIKSALFKECFSAKGLSETIGRYLAISDDEFASYKKEGLRIRDIFFLPVTEESMAVFYQTKP